MQRLYGAATDEQLEALAEQLGSDVKFMLKGGYARMQGRGERLTPIAGVQQPLHLLMLYPPTGVSAGACYREYDRQNPTDMPSQKTEPAIAALVEGDVETVGRCLTNDLYLPAATLCLDVRKALEELRAFAPLGAVMTGSGSAVLAVFESEELCRYAKSRYSGKFRTAVLKTLDPGENTFLKSPFVL
jgi:4-diphosphocytidyl-2-C-methyl-D-erythritol kinase